MPQKVRVAFGRGEHEPFVAFTQFMKHLNKYLAIKTLIGVITGVAVTIFLVNGRNRFSICFGFIGLLTKLHPDTRLDFGGRPCCDPCIP